MNIAIAFIFFLRQYCYMWCVLSVPYNIFTARIGIVVIVGAWHFAGLFRNFWIIKSVSF